MYLLVSSCISIFVDSRRVLRCRTELNCRPSEGKQLLVEVANGGSIPEKFAQNTFLRRLQKAARIMRWIACGQLPDLYASIKEADSRKRCS